MGEWGVLFVIPNAEGSLQRVFIRDDNGGGLVMWIPDKSARG